MADGKVVISTALDNGGLEKGIKAVAGKLGGLGKVAGVATASIVGAFSAAAIAVTKQAADAYADYEQLIGGVETLFKDSADKVIDYAEDAFYTVGLSANEYMETVTGFSASLISSLAGDTAKAADVADMALTDMADNANKMGSTLESVKTAYQGFAKQNYTMLDNLKLGYGGTKTEMERLLADAQKFTGVKYDISNLADVYNAIHAIQEKLGIAGTTAKEAEKTITGSANMTKAAWKNVLAAIAGGGDLDKAINNLVYSVTKYFDNMVPVVERSLSGVGRLIEQVAPQLVETVAVALIKAIPSLLNAVYQMIIGLANGIYRGIVALFSGSAKEISKQLNATEDLADNLNGAADGAENLAHATEKAGKAAKKSLAPFDEISKLSSADTPEDVFSPSPSITAGGTAAVDSTIVVSGDVRDNITPAIQSIIDKVLWLIEPLRDIDFAPVMESFDELGGSIGNFGQVVLDALEWAWFNILAPLSQWTIQTAAPAVLDTLSAAFDVLSAALQPVGSGLQILWDSLDPVFTWIGDTAIWILEQFQTQFDKIAQVFQEKGPEIEKIFSGLGEIVSAVWVIIEPVLEDLKEYWGVVFDYLGDVVSNNISAIIDTLGGIVEFFAGVFTGDWTRAVNGLIDIVNALISGVIGGINAIIRAANKLSFDVPDWVPGIGGATFGFSIPVLNTPQIPHLARGAVLPPNKPFMAVVGDQTHGTNVEAPLSTIQEAVAIVMEDMIASNMAGHEATVAVLREILEAILGIQIGDDVIGQAVARYNAKMATIRGGAT